MALSGPIGPPGLLSLALGAVVLKVRDKIENGCYPVTGHSWAQMHANARSALIASAIFAQEKIAHVHKTHAEWK